MSATRALDGAQSVVKGGDLVAVDQGLQFVGFDRAEVAPETNSCVGAVGVEEPHDPLDSRVLSFGADLAAASAVGLRGAPGSMTIPVPSAEMTSTSSGLISSAGRRA